MTGRWQIFVDGLRQIFGQISIAYILMMVTAGLTIGAITGLSNTSVTNTLLELILPFAAGSAGIYFLNQDTLRKEANALSVIGVVGVCFFVAFWTAYFPAAWYRHDAGEHFAWDAALPHEENFARAELFGHAQALAISRGAVAKALNTRPSNRTGNDACPFLSDDPKIVSQRFIGIFEPLTNAPSITSPVAELVAYLNARFAKLAADLPPAAGNRDAEKNNPAIIEFNAAIAELFLLSRNHPKIARPSTELCQPRNIDSSACVVVERFEQDLRRCANSVSTDMLLTARAHARAFQSIWNRSVPSASPPGTMETSR
jgi:hypothetical protein